MADVDRIRETEKDRTLHSTSLSDGQLVTEGRRNLLRFKSNDTLKIRQRSLSAHLCELRSISELTLYFMFQ